MNKGTLLATLAFALAAYGGTFVSAKRELRPSLGGAPVQAFGGLGAFKSKAIEGGGGGRYFTGSRRDGFTCGVCHKSDSFFGLEVQGLDASIEPGKRYTLKISWQGEAKKVSLNGEIVGPKGFVAGALATKDTSAGVSIGDKENNRQVFNLGQDLDREKSEMEIQWTAPDKSFEGPISVHVAAVRFLEKGPDDPLTPLANTEQAIFSAVIPFGKAKPSSDDKQGEQK